MTTPRLRRAGAVLAGFLSIALLSFATDEALHIFNFNSPLGLNALTLSYRLVYGVVGGYITARLAPYAPIHHSVILGLIGLVASASGAIVTISLNLGPVWYAIALVLTALPTAAAGGVLFAAVAWSGARKLGLNTLSQGAATPGESVENLHAAWTERSVPIFAPAVNPANPLLCPYTFRSPDCDDFQAPDFAAPSSSASTRLAQSKSPSRGS
jgi:hypothetical protein